MSRRAFFRALESLVGVVLLAVVWFVLAYLVRVPERYLPSPGAVINAWRDIYPPLYVHVLATASRIIIGTIAGTVLGVALGLLIAGQEDCRRLLLPSVLALRAVPPIATVPFFLVWFGFSEWGKFLLVATGVGLNIVVASLQILQDMEEKYVIALRSLRTAARSHPLIVSLPVVVQDLLPTLRTSIAIIFGAAIVSELLGSQVGLGYLIQTSRQTYSMHVVFLATLILGLLAAMLDWSVGLLWNWVVFWVPRSRHH